MKILETELFFMQLPEEWEAEQDDETFVIVDADEVSTLEVTPLKKEQGNIVMADLAEFTAELTEAGGVPTQVQVGDFAGEYFEYEEDGEFWREWFVFAEDLFLFITHGVTVDNKGLDDSTVNDILSTLILAKEPKS